MSCFSTLPLRWSLLAEPIICEMQCRWLQRRLIQAPRWKSCNHSLRFPISPELSS
jgi:hypothetical protein